MSDQLQNSSNTTTNQLTNLKTCIDCKLEKELSDFNKHQGFKDGYTSVCKSCKNIRTRKIRKLNKNRTWDVTSKVCSVCNSNKSLTEFNKHSGGKYGTQSYCKSCEQDIRNINKESNKEVSKAWRSKNEEKAKCSTRFYYYKKKGINITKEEYYKLLEDQDGKCAICNNPNRYRTLCLDHCHSTGKIRGFLCDDCNIALGKFKDNVELISKAIKYLKQNV